jgi:hypothetical protein
MNNIVKKYSLQHCIGNMAGRRIYPQLLFAIQLRFQQTNNTMQQNKQRAFVSLTSSGTRQTEHRIPPHRQCFNVTSKRIDDTTTTKRLTKKEKSKPF